MRHEGAAMDESMISRIAGILGHATDCAELRSKPANCDCGAAEKALSVVAGMRVPTEAMLRHVDRAAWQRAIDAARTN
jgi:hypothetical protein